VGAAGCWAGRGGQNTGGTQADAASPTQHDPQSKPVRPSTAGAAEGGCDRGAVPPDAARDGAANAPAVPHSQVRGWGVDRARMAELGNSTSDWIVSGGGYYLPQPCLFILLTHAPINPCSPPQLHNFPRFLSAPRHASPASRARSTSPHHSASACHAEQSTWSVGAAAARAPPLSSAARSHKAGGGFGADSYSPHRARPQPPAAAEQPAAPQPAAAPRSASSSPSRRRLQSPGRASALVEAAVVLEADLMEAREGAEALEARLRMAEEKIISRVG